jgi:gliding motility-associated-like protein
MCNKFFLTFLSFLIVNSIYSQGETNNWFFGKYEGVTFNSGNPVAILNGQIGPPHDEGCASMSSATGDLMFYTDGVTVWDKLHQIMPNGTDLLGQESSTQSAIIVPKPGSITLFYIFTANMNSVSTGLRYSIVDMSLNGGLGEVTVKNVLLQAPASEKVTAIKKNDSEYLIVTRGYGDNSFYTFSLTATGVNLTPVVSHSGMTLLDTPANPYSATQGYLRLSPSGNKIVAVNTQDGVEIFDFDINTGIVSNPVLLASFSGFYGAEFSPSGRFLYLSNLRDESLTTSLYQYDVNSVDIASSVIILASENSYPFSSIQLASNNKIYIIRYGKTTLEVINNPEGLGLSCDLQYDVVDLNVVGQANPIENYYGLPQFVVSYFSGINVANLCLGATTTFSLSNNNILSATWDFGDGSIGSGLLTNHIYSTTGIYNVSVEITTTTGIIIKTKEIIISDIPTATQPSSILACDDNNDGFHNFDLTQNTASILNGQSTSQYGVNYYANAIDFTNKVKIVNPANYQNILLPYQTQNIIAEVYNLDNSDCKATTTFDIQVFESPLPGTTILPIQLCDNTSFGTVVDGKVVFNLTSNQTTILNGQSATDFTLSYYKDAALTDLISNPTIYVNTNVVETIYVKMTNNQNGNCFATTSFQIEVFSLPNINATANLKQCDDNNDGFSAFNLIEANELVVASTLGLSFSYFETLTEAENNTNPIVNFTTYTNQTVSTDQVFIRVQNANGCFRVATLNLIVSTTLIPSTFQQTFTVCDDALSGSNTDGIATFDFSSATAAIQALYPVGQVLDITYYQNITDALAEQNPITNTSNFTNTSSPTTQNIFVRVDSQLDNECLGLGHHITLNVESLPIISPLSYIHCDDDQDGSFSFDTSTLETTFLNGLTNVTLAYWDDNNNPLPSPLPNPFNTTSQIVKVRATNNTTNACYFETNITFTVDDLPEAFAIPAILTTVCDDELNPTDQNGLFAFDTSSFQSAILGTQTGMVVNYFDGTGNPLSSPLPNPLVSGTQNITVEVINPTNSNCVATTIISLVVNPLPEIELYGDELICSNNPLFTKVINAGLLDETTISNFTYQWFLDGSIISTATNYDLTVNTEGVYTVEVTNSNGCVRTRTITVTASDIATINDIEIVDLSDDNSVTVLVTGLGNYEYSLDNEDYQSSNIFQNIASGIYTVYVRDLNGCGVVTEEISVLGIPNYFTPNGDGINDYWNVKGVNSNFNIETTIHIFDRYGKLLKQISPLSQGWDGTFNGNQMPSSDYWYSIHLNDGRNVKGHFSLKR